VKIFQPEWNYSSDWGVLCGSLIFTSSHIHLDKLDTTATWARAFENLFDPGNTDGGRDADGYIFII